MIFFKTSVEQQQVIDAAGQQTIQDWQPLIDAGVDGAMIENALVQTASAKPQRVEQMLAHHAALTAPWADLILSVDRPYSSVIRLVGVKDIEAVASGVAHLEGVQLIQPRVQMTRGFEHTREVSLWLKLASYPLAFVLLVYLYGLRIGAKLLFVPMIGMVVAVAALGWLGVTLSAFAVFGLLLVMAIGVDYAIYAHAHREETDTVMKYSGMLLAMVTTVLTFGLLACSQTPVVAGFGIAVAVGVLVSALLAMVVEQRQ